MSKDVETTVNVLSQTVNACIPKITGAEARLNAHEAALNTILSRVERLEDARTNEAKPIARVAEEVAKGALMVEVGELKRRLATTQEEFRRVEEERNQAWYGANRAAAEATAKCEQALRDAAETKKLLEDARREVQAHAKDRAEALDKVESLTRELKAAVAVGNATSKRLNERAAAHDEALREVAVLERHLAKAREDRESEREVNEQLKKQIEDLQADLAKARDDGARDCARLQADLAEARKETPAGVQDQFRLEKLGRLFDSLFAHEDDLTDETQEFWLSLETAGWLRPSRAQRFHSDMCHLRDRLTYLDAGLTPAPRFY